MPDRPTADPSPPDAESVRLAKRRMHRIAPTLVASLIHDTPVPDLTPPPPPPTDPRALRRLAVKEAVRRHRAKIRKARAAAREAVAQKREAAHEELAPSVLRRSIVAADGQIVRGPRIIVDLPSDGRTVRSRTVNSRPTVANPVLTMRGVSDAQKRAAAKLQADWREVGEGIGLGASDWLSAPGRGDGSGRHAALKGQIDAQARLAGALAWLGAFVPMMQRVVLHCVPLAVWAAEADIGVMMAKFDLAAALDRLVLFYEGEAVEAAPRILAIGPPRSEYVVARGTILT